MRADKLFNFEAGEAVSSGVDLAHCELVRLRIPALAVTTVGLQVETSLSAPSVADADATWDPALVDIDGNVILIPASTAAVQSVQLNPGNFMSLRRCRLRAVNGAGADVVQGDLTVTPTLREL